MSYQDPSFFELLCDRKLAIKILFGLALTFFVLNLPLVFVFEWGSANNVITVLNLFGSGGFVVGCYYVIRKCRTLS